MCVCVWSTKARAYLDVADVAVFVVNLSECVRSGFGGNERAHILHAQKKGCGIAFDRWCDKSAFVI